MSAELAAELIALAAEDQRVRSELLAEGTLFGGYHARMEAVHRRNASRLAEILAAVGWPGESLVGVEGATAAGMIAQHAIGEPDFQRACLVALERAAARGEVPAWQPAMLEDRIRVFEGRLQRYGTQLDIDDDGRVHPHPIEDPDGVEERRRAVGLDSLAERLARAERLPAPVDRAEQQRGYERWLREVGWRT
ncbi:MAG: hypothetical protein JWL95_2114 [Gemmatimonadetes bacterium]|nr:hypothetical protein [Gemmatimonadota bacterium]